MWHRRCLIVTWQNYSRVLVSKENLFMDKGSVVVIFSDMSVLIGIKNVIDRINANAAA